MNVADSNSLSFGDGSTDDPFTVGAWIYMNGSDNIKQRFGLSLGEYLAENAYGMYGANARPREAIDTWMTSRGHRYNLLYPTHSAGAVACYGGYCVFLGLNRERFGEGCKTGAEGMAFWESAAKQQGEV